MSKKKLLRPKTIVIVAIIVGVGLYLFIHYYNHATANSTSTQPTGTVNYGAPTKQEENLQNQTKQQIIKNSTSPSSTSTTSTNNTSISLSISRLSQASSGQDVQLRTVINGTSTGTCTVTFSQGSNVFTQTFQVSQEATYSTCNNANITAGSFPNTGVWNVSVVVTSGQNKSNTVEDQINVT